MIEVGGRRRKERRRRRNNDALQGPRPRVDYEVAAAVACIECFAIARSSTSDDPN